MFPQTARISSAIAMRALVDFLTYSLLLQALHVICRCPLDSQRKLGWDSNISGGWRLTEGPGESNGREASLPEGMSRKDIMIAELAELKWEIKHKTKYTGLGIASICRLMIRRSRLLPRTVSISFPPIAPALCFSITTKPDCKCQSRKQSNCRLSNLNCLRSSYLVETAQH